MMIFIKSTELLTKFVVLYIMDEETVTISRAEYDSLKDSEFKLECLEGAGVDNWNGYSYAMEEYYNLEED